VELEDILDIEDERYKPLVKFIEDVGIEDAVNILDLNDGEELTIKNEKGDVLFAKGKGRLYICYLPEDALED